MKVIAILMILLLGIAAGYVFFSGGEITGQATSTCYYKNEPCVCEEQCKCGNHTIRKEECYSNNAL